MIEKRENMAGRFFLKSDLYDDTPARRIHERDWKKLNKSIGQQISRVTIFEPCSKTFLKGEGLHSMNAETDKETTTVAKREC